MCLELPDPTSCRTWLRCHIEVTAYGRDVPGRCRPVAVAASGGLIAAERAYFVPVLINDRTGERDFRAYYSRGMADIAAQVLGVRVVSWDTIVARAKA